MLKKITRILFFVITVGIFSPCIAYAEVTRNEIISCNLDYYVLRVKTDSEKARFDAEAAKLMQERQATSQKAQAERLEKAGELIKKVSRDFKSNIVYKTKYDDNLYRVNGKLQDKEIAFITSLDMAFNYMPEIEWKKGHTAFKLDINAGPEIHKAKRGTFAKSKGGVNGELTHTRGKYTLGFKGGIARAYSVAQELKTATIISESLVDYWTRSYGASLWMDWHYIPSRIEYAHRDSLYEKRYRESNTSDDQVSLTNYFKLLPKTDFLFSYDYNVNARPDLDGVDSAAHTFWGGIRGKITSKVSGIVKVGYKFKEMEDKTKLNTEVAKASLDYRMTKRLSHSIAAERNTDTTTLEDESWVETNKFSLASTYTPPFGYERLSFGSSLRFTNYGYSTGRKDDLYEGGVNVNYAMRNKISVGLDYLFTCKSSDVISASYKDSVVTLKLEKEF